MDSSPIFSPNSKRLAYIAYFDYDELVTVIDGQEGIIYDLPIHYGQRGNRSLVFSPDSKHVAYVAGRQTRGWANLFVVFDGQIGQQYDGIIIGGFNLGFGTWRQGGNIVFSSGNSFQYLALRDGMIYLVEEKIK